MTASTGLIAGVVARVSQTNGPSDEHGVRNQIDRIHEDIDRIGGIVYAETHPSPGWPTGHYIDNDVRASKGHRRVPRFTSS